MSDGVPKTCIHIYGSFGISSGNDTMLTRKARAFALQKKVAKKIIATINRIYGINFLFSECLENVAIFCEL